MENTVFRRTVIWYNLAEPFVWMTFFKGLVLLDGYPIDSMKQQLFQVLGICQIKTESHRIKQLCICQNQAELYVMELFENSSKPHII